MKRFFHIALATSLAILGVSETRADQQQTQEFSKARCGSKRADAPGSRRCPDDPVAKTFNMDDYLVPKEDFYYKTRSICYENDNLICQPEIRGVPVENPDEFNKTGQFAERRWPECEKEAVLMKSGAGYPTETFCKYNGTWYLIEEGLDWDGNLSGRTFLTQGSNPNTRSGVTPTYNWVPANATPGQSIITPKRAAYQQYVCSPDRTLSMIDEPLIYQNHRLIGPFDLLTEAGRSAFRSAFGDGRTPDDVVLPEQTYTSVPMAFCGNKGVKAETFFINQDWWSPYRERDLGEYAPDLTQYFRFVESHVYGQVVCGDDSVHPLGRIGWSVRYHSQKKQPMLTDRSGLGIEVVFERHPVVAKPPCE